MRIFVILILAANTLKRESRGRAASAREVMTYRDKTHRGHYRWSVVAVIIGLLTGLALPAISPRVALATAPYQPVNVSPADGTTEISLLHPFEASAFSDPDSSDNRALATQWQVTRTPRNYSNPVFDTGVDFQTAATLNDRGYLSLKMTPSNLCLDTVYYWRVRYQNHLGWWSNWSWETSFRTIVSGAPSVPLNLSPVNGVTEMLQGLTLESTAFVCLDTGATHAASRWQIFLVSRDYSGPVYDSGPDLTDKTSLPMPAGTLNYSTTYYWRVKHQDSLGRWSDWSDQTSFTTLMQPPVTPTNRAPVNGANAIGVTPTLTGAPFSDPDASGAHRASQWQITTTSGDYSSPVLDSGADSTNKTKITVPWGKLSYSTTNYWRVRYQDSYGNWSGWSPQTSFTTMMQPPATPNNTSPASAATGVAITPMLVSSDFSQPDVGDSHRASQWQITGMSGNYTSPLFDSGPDTANKASLTVAVGKLSYNTTYYWHVRHQDAYGNWSDWSVQTPFTTTTQVPVTPANSAPVNGANGLSVTPTLNSAAFSDPDAGDSHKASQWQVTASAGNYASPVYDSGPDAINKTKIAVPAGKLDNSTAYYWRVRYQDSYGNWSAFSPETTFTVAGLIKADFSAAPFQASPGQAVTFSDTSSGKVNSWVWDFGDGTTAQWTARPDEGKLTHSYSSAGAYTVSLTVAGPAGKDTLTKANTILVAGAASPFGGGLPWVPIVSGLAVMLAGGGAFWYLRRRPLPALNLSRRR